VHGEITLLKSREKLPAGEKSSGTPLPDALQYVQVADEHEEIAEEKRKHVQQRTLRVGVRIEGCKAEDVEEDCKAGIVYRKRKLIILRPVLIRWIGLERCTCPGC
jgi:hypothetical protein